MGTRAWSTTSKIMLTISVLLIWAQIPFFVLKTTKPPSIRVGLSSSTADPVQPQNETLTVSPMQVVVAQLTVLDTIPEAYFKNALYPGAFTRHAQKKVECLTGYRTSKLCKQIAKSEWFPNWNTVVKHQDPKRLDQVLTESFREKKVQLVVGSIFYIIGSIVVLFSDTRLPFFGSVLYMWVLYQYRIMPRLPLVICTLCSFWLADWTKQNSSWLAPSFLRRHAGKTKAKPTLSEEAQAVKKDS